MMGKFVNHSKKHANCKAVKITTENKIKICLFAIKDIPAGVELRYDYGVPGLIWKVCTIYIWFYQVIIFKSNGRTW